jgi:hypothetical protein
MTGRFYSYLTPKAEPRPHPAKGNYGVYACEPISKGELLVLWGGRIVAVEELDPKMPDFTQRILQIEETLYMEAPSPLEPSDYFNHSCDPNAGMSGQIGLVAMRDINPGEEICFDYAMCDGSSYDEFPCGCGTLNCRGFISGNDWNRPELREKYTGFFSPYLQRRIDAIGGSGSQESLEFSAEMSNTISYHEHFNDSASD